MNVKVTRVGTKVTTGIVKLSCIHIFAPYAIDGIEGYEPRYSTTVIIPKNNIETIKAINEAIEQAKKDSDIKHILKTPLRDGDVERPENPLYKSCYFLNANSKNRPGVVDAAVQPILEPIEVNNGCYSRVSIDFYSYNSTGNKGVAAGLCNIQYIGGAM